MGALIGYGTHNDKALMNASQNQFIPTLLFNLIPQGLALRTMKSTEAICVWPSPRGGWAGTAVMLLRQNGWFSPADGSIESEQANAVGIGKPNSNRKEPKSRRVANSQRIEFVTAWVIPKQKGARFSGN
jgi:hypothetical protein